MRIWSVDVDFRSVLGTQTLRDGVVLARTNDDDMPKPYFIPGDARASRGPRAHWRLQTGMKFDMAQFFLTLPENACYTVA
jgi:hypothetical protein